MRFLPTYLPTGGSGGRALAELARRGKATPVPIGEIARARDIPVQFLEGLLATLRRAGIRSAA